MYLEEQFRFLYSMMKFTGINSRSPGNNSKRDKLFNHGYRNLLTVVCFVQVLVGNGTFERVVHRAEQFTVIGLEFFLICQTLTCLLILRNYYLIYSKEHQRLLAKLGNLCQLFNCNVSRIRLKTYLSIVLAVVPKLLIVVPYYLVLRDLIAIFMVLTLIFNTFSITVCVIESTFVIGILGGLFDNLDKEYIDDATRYDYSITLLETIDEINEFYGIVFLLVCVQKLSWITVVVYKYWIYPKEMIFFQGVVMQQLSRMAWSTTFIALLDLVFTCQRTISKVCRLLIAGKFVTIAIDVIPICNNCNTTFSLSLNAVQNVPSV